MSIHYEVTDLQGQTQGEVYDLYDSGVIVGTVKEAKYGDKSISLSLKDLLGDKEAIQNLSQLRGKNVRVILIPVDVQKIEDNSVQPVEDVMTLTY